jgi:cell division protein FtsW
MSAPLASLQATRATRKPTQAVICGGYDPWILGSALALLVLGLVMVASASIAIADREIGQPFYFVLRQVTFLSVSLFLASLVVRVPLAYWEKYREWLLFFGVLLLMLVLVPGIGRQVNGSMRWLALGPLNIQPSEFMKLFFVVYLAGYLVRHGPQLQQGYKGFMQPLLILGVPVTLLLLEPDFGAAVVLSATALGMMFLGGVRLSYFSILMALMLVALGALAFSSPYRLERLTTFLDPWADPFDSGFQLTQALIAFGRGEWLGVGLGESIQKLFYLPEAHTDFLFAVLAEELGLVGALGVITLFSVLIGRTFMLGWRAEQTGNRFTALLTYGLGLWLGFQTIINLGVNMGVLPTKGLTLPLMSYGGSSILTSCLAVALILRVDREGHRPPGSRRET